MKLEERKTMLLEGLLPTDVWNAMIVLIILFGVFIAAFKGYVMIRDEYRKRLKEKQLNSKDLTEEIADKVMEKLEPKIDKKFKEVDEKLANDKLLIEEHTRKLAEHKKRIDEAENGQKALGRCVYVLFSKSNGKEPTEKQIESANAAMENYLFGGKTESAE